MSHAARVLASRVVHDYDLPKLPPSTSAKRFPRVCACCVVLALVFVLPYSAVATLSIARVAAPVVTTASMAPIEPLALVVPVAPVAPAVGNSTRDDNFDAPLHAAARRMADLAARARTGRKGVGEVGASVEAPRDGDIALAVGWLVERELAR